MSGNYGNYADDLATNDDETPEATDELEAEDAEQTPMSIIVHD